MSVYKQYQYARPGEAVEDSERVKKAKKEYEERKKKEYDLAIQKVCEKSEANLVKETKKLTNEMEKQIEAFAEVQRQQTLKTIAEYMNHADAEKKKEIDEAVRKAKKDEKNRIAEETNRIKMETGLEVKKAKDKKELDDLRKSGWDKFVDWFGSGFTGSIKENARTGAADKIYAEEVAAKNDKETAIQQKTQEIEQKWDKKVEEFQKKANEEKENAVKEFSSALRDVMKEEIGKATQKANEEQEEAKRKAEAEFKERSNYGRFEWINNKVEGLNDVQNAYILDAYDEVTRVYGKLGYDAPHIHNLEKRYPGVDPRGKRCNLDMEIAQRLERVNLAAQLCTGKTKKILTRFLQSNFLDRLYSGEAGEHLRKIQVGRDLAKFCRDEETSKSLENWADEMESKAAEQVPEIALLLKVLTAMEQLGGIKKGDIRQENIRLENSILDSMDSESNKPYYILSEECVKACVEFNPNLLPMDCYRLPTGGDVEYIAPEQMELNIPDVENILLQDALENALITGAEESEYGLISTADKDECMRRCVEVATQNLMSLLYGQQGGERREYNEASGDQDLIIFGTKSARKGDSEAVMNVASALMANESVQACLPKRNGGFGWVTVKLNVPATPWVEQYSIYQKPLDEKEKQLVDAAQEGDGNGEIYWAANRLIAEDPKQMAYIRVAYLRARKEWEDGIFHNIPGLGEEYSDVDPHGKLCGLDMGFAHRLKRVKRAAQLCDGEQKRILNRLFESGIFSVLKEGIIDHCVKTRATRDIAKHCTDPVTRRKLADLVDRMENVDTCDCQEAKQMDALLTIAEQLLTLKSFPVKPEHRDVWNRLFPDREWDEEIENMSQVTHSMPEKLEIRIPDVQSVRKQEVRANPKYLGVPKSEIPLDDVPQEVWRDKLRSTVAATNDMVDMLFRYIDKVYRCENKYGSNRAEMIYVDGRPLWEHMSEIYASRLGLDDPKDSRWFTDDSDEGIVLYEDEEEALEAMKEDEEREQRNQMTRDRREQFLSWCRKNVNAMAGRVMSQALLYNKMVEIRYDKAKEPIPFVLIEAKPKVKTVLFEQYESCRGELTLTERQLIDKATELSNKDLFNSAIRIKNGKPECEDPLKAIFIKIGLTRAKSAYLEMDDPNPRIMNLDQEFRGVNPHGKFSRVEMKLEQSINGLNELVDRCPEKNRALLEKFINSPHIAELMKEICEYTQQIRTIRDAAKFCPDKATSEELEIMANRMERRAVKKVRAARELHQAVTVMEQVAGKKGGVLSQEGIECCKKFGVEVPTDIAVGDAVKYIEDAPRKIFVPDMEKILIQNAMAAPDNVGKKRDEIYRAVLPEVDNQMRKWTDDMVSTLFKGREVKENLEQLVGGVSTQQPKVSPKPVEPKKVSQSSMEQSEEMPSEQVGEMQHLGKTQEQNQAQTTNENDSEENQIRTDYLANRGTMVFVDGKPVASKVKNYFTNLFTRKDRKAGESGNELTQELGRFLYENNIDWMCTKLVKDAILNKRNVEVKAPPSDEADGRLLARFVPIVRESEPQCLYDQYAQIRGAMTPEERDWVLLAIQEPSPEGNAILNWDGEKVVSNDPMQRAFIKIALDRAEAAEKNRDDDCPRICGLAQEYEGVNPNGKFSRLEMTFAKQINQLKLIRPMLSGKNREIMDKFIDTFVQSKMFEQLSNKVAEYGKSVRTVREMAKWCPDRATSMALEQLANRMENLDFAKEEDPSVRTMSRIMTCMKTVGGIQEGEMDEIRSIVENYIGIDLPEDFPTGAAVVYDASARLEVEGPPCVEDICRQEIMARPENYGKLPQEITITEADKTECMCRYTETISQNALSIFGKDMSAEADCTKETCNRGTMMVVDGVVVADKVNAAWEAMASGMKAEEKSLIQPSWYYNNVAWMCNKYAQEALHRGGKVELKASILLEMINRPNKQVMQSRNITVAPAMGK